MKRGILLHICIKAFIQGSQIDLNTFLKTLNTMEAKNYYTHSSDW